VYLLATERVRKDGEHYWILAAAILSSTVFLLVINVAMGKVADGSSGLRRAALLGLGLISQLGGYLALTYAMGHLPATVTSVSFAFPGPAYRAACRAAAPRADDRSANPWRSAGAGGSGGWPAGGSIRRKKQMLRCARQASTNKLETILEEPFITLWRCANISFAMCALS